MSVNPRSTADASADEDFGAVWTILTATGLALSLAAIVVVVSRWYPSNVRDAYWLYITTGGTLDAFTIVTIGMLALCVALVAQGSAAKLRVYALTCLVLATIVIAIYGGMLMSLPPVIREASENSFNARTVRYGIFRASLSAAIAVGLYLWFAMTSFKRAARADAR